MAVKRIEIPYNANDSNYKCVDAASWVIGLVYYVTMLTVIAWTHPNQYFTNVWTGELSLWWQDGAGSQHNYLMFI